MRQTRLGYQLYYLMTLNVLHMFFKHQFSSENKGRGQGTLYGSLYLLPWSRSRDIETRNIIEDSCWHLVFWRAVLSVWEKTPRKYTSLRLGVEGSGGLEPQVFSLACLLGLLDDIATMLSSSPTKLKGSCAWQYRFGTNEQKYHGKYFKGPPTMFSTMGNLHKFIVTSEKDTHLKTDNMG